MTKLAPIKPVQFIRILEGLGFKKVRQKGSHIFTRHPDGRTTVAPMHKGEDISNGLLRKILNDTDISVEQFNRLR